VFFLFGPSFVLVSSFSKMVTCLYAPCYRRWRKRITNEIVIFGFSVYLSWISYSYGSQSTYIYIVPVCPLVGIGTLPPLLSPASVPLPPEPKGGGHTRLRVRGWGSPNFDDWRKSLALCLLCAMVYLLKLVGFGRAAYTSLLGSLTHKAGRCALPPPISILLPSP
jgi:hypothetical protein